MESVLVSELDSVKENEPYQRPRPIKLLPNVSVLYEHLRTILFKPFLSVSVSVSASVKTQLWCVSTGRDLGRELGLMIMCGSGLQWT